VYYHTVSQDFLAAAPAGGNIVMAERPRSRSASRAETPSSSARLEISLKSTSENAARQQPLERITVNLLAKVGEDLQRLHERTSLSKTDILNRAITLYEFLDDRTRNGHNLILRNESTGETQLIRIL
jgi:hypothetical protein